MPAHHHQKGMLLEQDVVEEVVEVSFEKRLEGYLQSAAAVAALSVALEDAKLEGKPV